MKKGNALFGWLLIPGLFIVSVCSTLDKEYHNNGELKSVSRYDNHGHKHGPVSFYDTLGHLINIDKYHHGKLKLKLEYFTSGHVYSKTTFRNKQRHGEFLEYHPNGFIKFKAWYKHDTVVRLSEYDTTNHLKREFIHINKIPEFHDNYIRVPAKFISSEEYSEVQVNIPGIPASQIIPTANNGKVKPANPIMGLWKIKAYSRNGTLDLSLNLQLSAFNDSTIVLGSKTYDVW